MGITGQSVSLPVPYPDLSTQQWDAFALLRNLQFLATKITSIETGQLMPSGAIIMLRSGTTCPDGYTKVSDAGLPGRFLRIATSGGGTGGTSLATVVSAGAHTHTNSIPTSTRLVTSAATGTTFLVASSTHIHTINSAGAHTHHVTVAPIYLDVILCEKD